MLIINYCIEPPPAPGTVNSERLSPTKQNISRGRKAVQRTLDVPKKIPNRRSNKILRKGLVPV